MRTPLEVEMDPFPKVGGSSPVCGRQSLRELFRALGSSPGGLPRQEAAARLAQYGPNEIARVRHLAWHSLLLECFQNPLVVLLAVLAVISYWNGDKPGSLLIACMVLLSVGLTFVQEYRSNRAAEKLRAMVHTLATVLRPPGSRPPSRGASRGSAGAKDGAPNGPQPSSGKNPVGPSEPLVAGSPVPVEIPLSEVVPGDVVSLSAGDMIPADLRLLSSKDPYQLR